MSVLFGGKSQSHDIRDIVSELTEGGASAICNEAVAGTDDELMEKVYRLCPICGSVSQNYSGEMNCGHNQSLYLYLSEDSKPKMNTDLALDR